MNQSQAIVTAVIRVAATAIILLRVSAPINSIATQGIPLDTLLKPEVSGSQLSEAQIKALDFAGGTVVHVDWIGIFILILCVLLIVFSKTVATWITPKHKET